MVEEAAAAGLLLLAVVVDVLAGEIRGRRLQISLVERVGSGRAAAAVGGGPRRGLGAPRLNRRSAPPEGVQVPPPPQLAAWR